MGIGHRNRVWLCLMQSLPNRGYGKCIRKGFSYVSNYKVFPVQSQQMQLSYQWKLSVINYLSTMEEMSVVQEAVRVEAVVKVNNPTEYTGSLNGLDNIYPLWPFY